MKLDASFIWDLWEQGGPFIGENRSNAYVTVQRGWWLRKSRDLETALTYRPYRSFQRRDFQEVQTIVPNIKSINIERSIDQDAATCTIVMDNTKMLSNEPSGPDAELMLDGQLGLPGYYTPYYGDTEYEDDYNRTQEKIALWKQPINEWQGVLVPNGLIRTFEGYGGYEIVDGNMVQKPINDALGDGNIIRTGTWLVDEVDISTSGTITLKCRDMAKLLLEQLIYPPLIPDRLYPLEFYKWRWKKVAGGGLIKVNGNYTDLSEIIRFLIGWSGWWLADEDYIIPTGTHAKMFGNIAQTGTWSEEALPRDLFDKKPVMEAINSLREIVNYYFAIKEDGSAHFDAPNWYSPGNFDNAGNSSTFIPEVHEEHNLVSYDMTLSDKSSRSEIIISTYDPTEDFEDTITTRIIPPSVEMLHGMVRPAMWINAQYLKNPEEQRVMAELIALRIYFAERIGSISCIANPAIFPDDQIRIIERTTSSNYIHYVRSVSTQHDLVTGSYMMNLGVNWLGELDDWAVQVGGVGSTKKYYYIQFHDTWEIVLANLEETYGRPFSFQAIVSLNQQYFIDTGGALLFGSVIRVI